MLNILRNNTGVSCSTYITRYVHASTPLSCILALPVLEICGSLGEEGDMSVFHGGVLPVN